MKRGILNIVTLMALVLAQVTVGAAQAGGKYKRHGPGYSTGYYKGYGNYYSGHRGGGKKGKGGGYGYGQRYDDDDKYAYLLGGMLIGGAATYLLTQPRYVERQPVVYGPAPAVASGYSADYRDYPQHSGRYRCCDYESVRSYAIDPINGQYLANCITNVRAGPGTRYHVIDQVRTRELVTVIGKVQGRDWYQVRVGARIGYVYAPLLEPAYYVENPYGEAGASPGSIYGSREGAPCREYTTTVIVGGQEQSAYGTACRQPDGSWKISSSEPL